MDKKKKDRVIIIAGAGADRAHMAATVAAAIANMPESSRVEIGVDDIMTEEEYHSKMPRTDLSDRLVKLRDPNAYDPYPQEMRQMAAPPRKEIRHPDNSEARVFGDKRSNRNKARALRKGKKMVWRP